MKELHWAFWNLVSYSCHSMPALPSWAICDRSVMILESFCRLFSAAGFPRGMAGGSGKNTMLAFNILGLQTCREKTTIIWKWTYWSVIEVMTVNLCSVQFLSNKSKHCFQCSNFRKFCLMSWFHTTVPFEIHWRECFCFSFKIHLFTIERNLNRLLCHYLWPWHQLIKITLYRQHLQPSTTPESESTGP